MPFKSLPHPKKAGAGAKNTPQKGHRGRGWRSPLPHSGQLLFHPQPGNPGAPPRTVWIAGNLDPRPHKAALRPAPSAFRSSTALSLAPLALRPSSAVLVRIFPHLQNPRGPQIPHLAPTPLPFAIHLHLPLFTAFRVSSVPGPGHPQPACSNPSNQSFLQRGGGVSQEEDTPDTAPPFSNQHPPPPSLPPIVWDCKIRQT